MLCLAPWALLLQPVGVWAQSEAVVRTVAVSPNASVSQTFSTNPHLLPSDASAGSITRLSAGVNLRGQSGLVRGFVDYSLSRFIYSGGENNSLQNTLSAALDTDLLDGRAKLALNANIAQSAVSAFSTQPSLGGGSQTNSTEVRTIRLAPSFRGPLGPDLRYTGEVTIAATDAKNTLVGDNQALSAALHVEPVTTGQVAWGLDVSHARSGYKLGRLTNDDRLYGSLNYRLDLLDLLLQANAGLESTDLAGVQRQSYRTWGFGATWTPSPRTKVAAQYDHLFFGGAHNVVLEHRTALTTWRFSDSKRLSTAGDTGSGGTTARDLFMSVFSSTIPDAAQRATYVSNFLSQRNIPETLGVGFLRSAATVQSQQEASFALRDARSAAVFTATRGSTRRLSTIAGLVGDLATSTEVRLRSVSLDLSHRLTPLSNLNLRLSEQRGRGDLANQDSRQRQVSLQYTTRPTQYSDLSVGLRRAHYEVQFISYGESALFANYGIRF